MGRWVWASVVNGVGALLALVVALGVLPMLWWGWDVAAAVERVRLAVIPVVGMAAGFPLYLWWSERQARKRAEEE